MITIGQSRSDQPISSAQPIQHTLNKQLYGGEVQTAWRPRMFGELLIAI